MKLVSTSYAFINITSLGQFQGLLKGYYGTVVIMVVIVIMVTLVIVAIFLFLRYIFHCKVHYTQDMVIMVNMVIMVFMVIMVIMFFMAFMLINCKDSNN